jgi:tetratricopeptide (TPR) repeat protein
LLRKRGGLVADHPEPVATTWALSFEQAQAKNPAAADLLCFCAFLAPDAIPEEILTAGTSTLGPVLAPVVADPFQFNQVLEALRAYSLVRRNPVGKTLSIHRLVQAVLQETLSEEERHNWRERVILAINAAFPHAEPEAWAQCERLLSQILFATQLIEQNQMSGKEAGLLLSETAYYLQKRARYAEAEPLYWQALHIHERQLGPEHIEVAFELHGLATLYFEQDKYMQAEPLYQRALHILEQRLGPEHTEVCRPLTGLATLYLAQGKYAQAKSLDKRVLRLLELQLGPGHPDVARSLTNLATLYVEQGKYTQAKPLYQRALRIWKQQLGPEHPDVARSLNGLATLYLKQGKYAQAKPLYQRALHLLVLQL